MATPGRNSSLPHDDWIPARAYITGITVALAGILSFFIALVSAYVVRKGSPAGDWRNLTIPHILWLNTAILAVSSYTLNRSRKQSLLDDASGFRHWWGVTATLGLFFLADQTIAWHQLATAGIYVSTNPSSSFFYVLTAAHGLHVLGGIVGLLVVALRPARYPSKGIVTRGISIYWHSMTGLWIVLFLLFSLNP